MKYSSRKNVGRLIKRAMVDRGMTQQQLADQIGTSNTALSALIAGSRPLHVGRLAEITAAILGDDLVPAIVAGVESSRSAPDNLGDLMVAALAYRPRNEA